MMNREKVHSMLKEYLINKNYMIVNGYDSERGSTVERIEKAVNLLEDSKKKVIKMYYFENKSIGEIVTKIHYTRQWCYSLRMEAIDDLVKLLNTDESISN